MPVIGIPVSELHRTIGQAVERDRLLRILGDIGCDVEGYETLGRRRCAACGFVIELVGKEEVPPRCDRCDADLRAERAVAELPPIEVVRMELLAVRPDLFDPGGLGRALRGLLGLEAGAVSYEVGAPRLRLRIDPSVRRERSSRPHIACAVLEEVAMDDDRLKIIMKMQENLHWALGRNRKHASIGVYDLDRCEVEGAPAGAGGAHLEYTTESPDDYAFVPLGAAGEGPEHRRSLRRILEEHPKGVAFAHLLAGFDRYPILRTTAGRVLSMPPIINSEETKVHPGSRRLFLDVTGSGRRVVHRTLNILVTSLLELDPGARLGAVHQIGPDGEEMTPDLTPQEAWLDTAAAAKLLGIPLDEGAARALLRRMRHDVGHGRDGSLQVFVPAYRNDVLHERDLVEDLAIAHGYGNFPQTLVPHQTVAREQEIEMICNRAREALGGLGFVETLNLVLTSPAQSDAVLRQEPHPLTVLLENPVSLEQTQLRTSLLPGLLTTLARNRSNPLPQAIYEIGDATLLDASAETGARESRQLAFALISPKSGFADLRALVEAVVREFDRPLVLVPATAPFLLEGRSAWVRRADQPPGTVAGEVVSGEVAAVDGGHGASGAGGTWGVMGEVHPEVLESLGLQNPTVVCELTIPLAGADWEYRSIGVARTA